MEDLTGNPGIVPAGFIAARASVSGSPPISPREAEFLTELLLRDGRPVPTATLARRIFGDARDTSLVRQLVTRIRRKLGTHIVETTIGGYRVPPRHRHQVPACCARCGAPVEFADKSWWCEDCGRSGEFSRPGPLPTHASRRPYTEGTRQGQPWTDTDRAFVLAHLDDMTLDDLAIAIDRTPSAVRAYLALVGVRKPYVRRQP